MPAARAPSTRLSVPLALLAAITFAGATATVTAQQALVHAHWEHVFVQSGVHQNPYPIETVVWRDIVTVPAALPWVRLHFDKVQLDKQSRLRIVSLRDGAVQLLDAVSVRQWNDSSAYFNGNAVMVELIAGPGTQKNYVEIRKVWAGDDPATVHDPETICGTTDDRIPSSHVAIGRLDNGCTAWIINRPTTGNDRVHLSAGHCFPGAGVLQFNVPGSANNCSLVNPPPSLQFAIDNGSLQYTPAPTIGNDYAVFRCFPNSTTGLTTFQTQGGSITLATALPGAGTTLRVTGFGTDGTSANNAAGGNNSCTCTPGNGTGSRNQIQQTHTGPIGTASGTTVTYAIDTCGGNSGSPVFHEATAQAIAIHTNGGCTTSSSSFNSGTAVTSPALLAAINAVAGGSSLPNDECPGAVPVYDGGNGPFSTAGASTSAPAWPCGSGGADLWYRYTATCTGNVTIDTCTATAGQHDTVLQVFAGSCASPLSLACNDDTCGLQSRVTVGVQLGVTYYIRVGGYSSATGSFVLTITGCSNAADECQGALTLALGGNGPFSNAAATTTSSPAWTCGGGGRDLWYRYDAPCAGTVQFSTCDAATSLDTVLAVYTGTCGGLVLQACNDNASCAANPSASAVTVTPTQATTYYVRVGGRNAASGTFLLNVTLSHPNEDCAGALPVNVGANGPFCNIAATTSSPAWPCGSANNDVWFAFTAPCTGQLVVDTCSGGTNFDTVLEVLAGACGGLGSLGCNDDACNLQSSLTVNVTQGQTYRIRVGGFVQNRGDFMLNVACTAVGDDCSQAVPLNLGSNGPFSNAGATTSAPPWPCGSGGADVWFSYTATCTAPHTFSTCTPTRTLDTVLEVLAGTCAATASLLCNDDACGTGSRVTVSLVQGQSYLIRVGGFNGASGAFDVTAETGTGTGHFTTLPHGCGSLTITPSGSPSIGGTVAFQLGNVQGLPFYRIGFAMLNQPLCAPGPCTLGPGFEVSLFGTVYSLSVPCHPAYIGAVLGVQGADILAPGGCNVPLPVVVSDTIQVTIG